MEFSFEYKTPFSPHMLIVGEHLMALVDNQTTIHYLDPVSGKAVGDQPFEAPLEHPHFRGNASAPDGQRIVLFFPEKIHTYLLAFDSATGRFKRQNFLSWSEAASEVSVFSKDGQMVATGGNDGRVCIYRTDNGRLLTIPPRHNEYIFALDFSSDGSLIAYASFKKRLSVYDLARHALLSGYTHKEVINCVAFMHRSSFLVMGSRDNKVVLFDVINGFVIRELISTVNWPMALYVDPEDQFCFVSDKAGYLYLIDLSVPEPDSEPIFSSKSVVVDIKRRAEAIYFAFDDGSVRILDMAAEREKFTASIEKKDMASMYQLMQDNPVLKFSATGVLGGMDERFNDHFSKAVLLIAKGKTDAAKEAMGDLLEFPTYQKRFEAVSRHASKVATFWQLIQSGQYAEAYSMASEGDFYRRLPLYKMLEDRFNQRFYEAVKALNAPGADPQKVREELTLFMKVPQKEAVIKSMLRSPEIFAKAQRAADEKDWPELGRLVEKFKMLRGAPVVQAYQTMLQEQEERFLTLMAAGRFEEAFEPAKFLKENSQESSVALKIEFKRLEKVEEFKAAVEAKKYGEAMQMAVDNPFLITSNAYKALDRMLSARFKAAHQYATKLEFGAVDKLMRPFLKNPFSKNRALGIYKTIYLEQIAAVGAKMQKKHWVNALKNYVARFGVDNEIELLARRFDQDRLLEMFEGFEGANFFRYPLIPHVVKSPFTKPRPPAKKGS